MPAARWRSSKNSASSLNRQNRISEVGAYWVKKLYLVNFVAAFGIVRNSIAAFWNNGDIDAIPARRKYSSLPPVRNLALRSVSFLPLHRTSIPEGA